MEILLFFVLIYAAKRGWDDAWEAWRKSRSAYMTRADRNHPHMPKGKRAGHALRHDIGYGLSQLRHGFPQVRHGFAAGWHQGRQAHAQALAAREKAKAENLETRARLIPDLRDYRRRQKEALDLIRRGAAPQEPDEALEPEEGSDGSSASSERICPSCGWAIPGTGPCPVCGEPETEGSDEPDGRTYSWGPADSPYGWPAKDDAEKAHRWAQHMSTGGKPQVVTEYPPGGGPGRTVATYADGEPVADCDLCGKPLPPGYAGIAHPDCIDAHEREDDQPDPTTEGNDMPDTSADTTYTQQLNELTAIRQDAEEEVNSVRRKRMMNRLDILSGLGLDSASLSEAAAIDDALKEQEKAAQQTLDAADAAINGLKQRHGGIQEAVDSSPVDKPAQPEFYEN